MDDLEILSKWEKGQIPEAKEKEPVVNREWEEPAEEEPVE